MATYKHVHRFRDDHLKTYLELAKRGYETLAPGIRKDLLIANKDTLFACNSEARIDFAEIALQAIEDFALAALEPHHFVTYTPADAVFPIEQAASFDIRILKQRLRQAMPDIPFIAMVEAALYKDWGPAGPFKDHDSVSWHVHLITWSITRDELEKALRSLSDNVPNMYDRPSIWIRKVSVGELGQVLLYLLKGQVKEYRVNQTPGTTTDQATGEVRYRTRQQKRWMRTGNHVRMCGVLDGRRLPELIFGNASGTWLARHIRHEAMKPFCLWAAHENRRAEFDGRELPYPQVEKNMKLGRQLNREADTIRQLFPGARIQA